MKVETTELVMRLVDVVTVETTVDVEVVVKRPPKGANRRIVDKGFVTRPLNPTLEPTMKPLLGEVM